jgi:hypothetical protein
MNRTAIAPSPTLEATRLTEPCRTSPAAKIPGTLVSRKKGSRSNFCIFRALLQFEMDRVECLLEALDDVDRFYWVHDAFAFLFIDAYSQHIYFVDKVCMQATQSGTCIIVIVHSVLLQLYY